MATHLQSRSGNEYLTNRSWRTRTDSKKVMADQSVHDVVKQPQSVDALRLTDASVTNNAESAALAAADDSAPNGSDTQQTNLPQPIENDETSQQIAANVESVVPDSQLFTSTVSKYTRLPLDRVTLMSLG